MSDIRSGSARPAARAIEPLIGREELLENIKQALQTTNTATNILFLNGDGGNGKTRMLYAITDFCRADRVQARLARGLRRPAVGGLQRHVLGGGAAAGLGRRLGHPALRACLDRKRRD